MGKNGINNGNILYCTVLCTVLYCILNVDSVGTPGAVSWDPTKGEGISR